MIEIVDMEQEPVTDQKVIEALNTIKRYCDCRYCRDCVIQKVCEEYFNQSEYYPEDWPEMEVPYGKSV